MNGGLKIGELARRAGVTPKAIRFYETRRILPPANRAANRYRLYGDDAVEMLRFIKQAIGLGLTLAEIKDIISIRQDSRASCGMVTRSWSSINLIASRARSRINSGCLPGST